MCNMWWKKKQYVVKSGQNLVVEGNLLVCKRNDLKIADHEAWKVKIAKSASATSNDHTQQPPQSNHSNRHNLSR